MSEIKYGIYLAYPPTVDLRAEGLGRHLAMFLKGAEKLGNLKFTIVCPSWSQKTLQELFESEQVSTDTFIIDSPKGKPYALKIFEALNGYRRKRNKFGELIRRLMYGALNLFQASWDRFILRAVSVHSLQSLLSFILQGIGLVAILLPLSLFVLPVLLIKNVKNVMTRVIRKLLSLQPHWLKNGISHTSISISKPEKQGWILKLFDQMQEVEATRMQKVIEQLPSIKAWYCPTAFWPAINNIESPKLICVPDVVLSSFPVGFSTIGGDWTMMSFKKIEKTILNNKFFVTYSDTVKWNTLVDGYGISPDNVTTIPHAPNALNSWLELSGAGGDGEISREYSLSLMRSALQRSKNPIYGAALKNDGFKYLFYASQFRPSKNVLTLLRAYKHLLRSRHLGIKLVLTGNPSVMPEIGAYVSENGLERDIVFLEKLSVAELAAVYSLATLAVNPSLSEGGCPFTFTEALSVQTPVVMARISVAEEILTDEELQRVTFFDPYDWNDCANRIEWALQNRDELLTIQRRSYMKLSDRSWSDVVNEHLNVLMRISS
jgi:glycosyltransferase involved in cell wall biosynthesis